MLDLAALRQHVLDLQQEWGVHPILILSCPGGSDEHWQLWHPDDVGCEDRETMPHLVVLPTGEASRHPDSAR